METAATRAAFEPIQHRRFREAVALLSKAEHAVHLAEHARDRAELAVRQALQRMTEAGVRDSGLSMHYRINLLGEHHPEPSDTSAEYHY